MIRTIRNEHEVRQALALLDSLFPSEALTCEDLKQFGDIEFPTVLTQASINKIKVEAYRAALRWLFYDVVNGHDVTNWLRRAQLMLDHTRHEDAEGEYEGEYESEERLIDMCHEQDRIAVHAEFELRIKEGLSNEQAFIKAVATR